jgi:hypothetical protein
MKNLESSIQNILNEEYIEENIDKVKDLYDNRNIVSTLKEGDSIFVGFEYLKNDGSSETKGKVFIVDEVETLRNGLIRVLLDHRTSDDYVLFLDKKGMLVFRQPNGMRLVVSSISKK